MAPKGTTTDAMNDAKKTDGDFGAQMGGEAKRDVVYVQQPAAASTGFKGQNLFFLVILLIIAVCSIIMVGELASVVSFTSKNNEPATIIINNGDGSGTGTTSSDSSNVDNVPDDVVTFNSGSNVCAGKKPDLPNVECVVDALTNVGPQAGANVTKGYVGGLATESVPVTTPYWMNGMCPVNVHWHLGAEHLSEGEFDQEGTGPGELETVDGGIDGGFRCKLFDDTDPKFTKPYEWKHCIGMNVGETYEVPWPHSAAGACGTPNQFQTPFYDGASVLMAS